ncbi:hypothetical protein [Alloactinosynnema sp. L-07]|nr:hypothetical protein [Alloactinosynnema sp. L-07]
MGGYRAARSRLAHAARRRLRASLRMRGTAGSREYAPWATRLLVTHPAHHQLLMRGTAGSREYAPWGCGGSAPTTKDERPGPRSPWTRAPRARGDEGNRTPNPCLAKAVLCQLSYVPDPARCHRAGWSQAFLTPLLAAGVVASRHRSASAFAELLRRTTRRTPPAIAASARSFFTSYASLGTSGLPTPHQSATAAMLTSVQRPRRADAQARGTTGNVWVTSSRSR